MALSIPADNRVDNLDNDYDPESPKLIIAEEIDVESVDTTETEMDMNESPEQAQSVIARDLRKDIANINKFIQRMHAEQAVHRGPLTSIERSQNEIEAPTVGQKCEFKMPHTYSENRNPPTTSAKRQRIEIEASTAIGAGQQSAHLPHEPITADAHFTREKRPRIEIGAPSVGKIVEQQQQNNFPNKLRKSELSDAELVCREQASACGKSARNVASAMAEEQKKQEFLDTFLPPEFHMSDLELARRAQLHQREEQSFENFLKRADDECPLELTYNDRKARKSVSECDCNEPDCNECKRWIRNLKSLESRHRANAEYRLNLLRILYLQERIERITKIDKMMKAILCQGFDAETTNVFMNQKFEKSNGQGTRKDR